jgi:hypothetical protein
LPARRGTHGPASHNFVSLNLDTAGHADTVPTLREAFEIFPVSLRDEIDAIGQLLDTPSLVAGEIGSVHGRLLGLRADTTCEDADWN